MFSKLWWVLFLFTCRFLYVSAYEKSLAIYPKHAALKPNGDLNVTCTLAAELQWCRFWVQYQNTTLMTVQDGPVFYISRYNDRTVMENYPRSRTAAPYDAVVEYQEKECRLQLSNVSEGRYLVGCRTDPWSYNSLEEKYMGLYVDEDADEFERNKIDINMIQNVTYGDDNAKIVFELEDSNYFTEPCKLDVSQNVTLREGQSPMLNNNKTKCTLPILANDAANGPVWITAKTTNKGITVTRRYMRIIVAKKPLRITLSSWLLPHNDGPAEEILLTAICGVYESEHRMYISWSLMNGTENDFPDFSSKIIRNNNEWTWPWVKKSSQALMAASIPASDIGKTLTCKIEFKDNFGNDLLTTKKEIVLTLNNTSVTQVLQTTATKEPMPQTPLTDAPMSQTPLTKAPFTQAPLTTDTIIIMLIALSVMLVLAITIAIVVITAYLRAPRLCCFKPANARGENELAVQFRKDSRQTLSEALYDDVNLQLHG